DAKVDDYKPSYAAASDLVDRMYQMPVPAEAANFHKAELVVAENIRGLIGQAQNYAVDSATKPWPTGYASYTIMGDRQKVVETEFNKLDSKYQLSQIAPRPVSPLVELGLVKEAHAQFAVADIPQTVRYVAD